MPIRLEDVLFALEERFWIDGEEFFQRNLAYTALMVFPEPVGVLLKDEIESSVNVRARWSQVELEEHRVLELVEDAVLVTYKFAAMRPET